MKENCRKLLAALLILALMASFCGCTAPAPAETSSVESGPSSQPVPEPVSEPAPAPAPDPQATEDDEREGAKEDAADIAEEEDIAADEVSDAELRSDAETPEIGRNYTTVYPSDGIVIPLLQEIADQYADGLTAVLRNMDCGNYDGDMPKDVTALFAYQNEAEENVAFRFFRCSGTRTEDGEHHLTVDSVDEWDAE